MSKHLRGFLLSPHWSPNRNTQPTTVARNLTYAPLMLQPKQAAPLLEKHGNGKKHHPTTAVAYRLPRRWHSSVLTQHKARTPQSPTRAVTIKIAEPSPAAPLRSRYWRNILGSCADSRGPYISSFSFLPLPSAYGQKAKQEEPARSHNHHKPETLSQQIITRSFNALPKNSEKKPHPHQWMQIPDN